MSSVLAPWAWRRPSVARRDQAALSWVMGARPRTLRCIGSPGPCRAQPSQRLGDVFFDGLHGDPAPIGDLLVAQALHSTEPRPEERRVGKELSRRVDLGGCG